MTRRIAALRIGGSGALFAAYLLLTSAPAIAGKVLDNVDPMVHIDALEWGGKRRNALELSCFPSLA